MGKRKSKQNPARSSGYVYDNDMETPLIDQDDDEEKGKGLSMTRLDSARRSHHQHQSMQQMVDNEGYGYDLVILVPNPADCRAKGLPPPPMSVEEFHERLRLGGLDVYAYYTADSEFIVLKIRAKLNRLKEYAEETEFWMQLDEKWLAMNDDKEYPVAYDENLTRTYHPYQFIYSPYRDAAGYNHAFGTNNRLKLLYSILKTTSGGCGLNVDMLKMEKSIATYFPLHEKLAREIALYFEFLGHYTHWLRYLTFGGAICTIDIIVEAIIYGSLNAALIGAYSVPLFCVFVSFWAQIMIEYWKQDEATKAMEWGTTHYEEEEEERPEFKGKKVRSVINGKMTRYFSDDDRARLLFWSGVMIAPMIILVLGIVGTIFYCQIIFQQSSNPILLAYGNTITSVANAVQIQVMSYIYSYIAVHLNDQENHRTQTEYEDSLIAKLFVFNFINSYASLYYIAFVKPIFNHCLSDNCMGELATTLGTIFVTRLTIIKLNQFLTLFVSQRYQEFKDRREKEEARARGEAVYDGELSQAEKEAYLNSFDSVTGVISLYSEIFIQYGYVTLFVASFPLAPLLAFMSNYVEIRTSGYELLYMFQRIMPSGAQDIGTWLSILEITSMFAVITNAGLICFTMDVLPIDEEGRVWIFIVLQYFVFTMMALFAYVVEDIPEEVTIQLARQEHLLKLLNGEFDHKEEEGGFVHGKMDSIQIHEADEQLFPRSHIKPPK